MLEKSNFIGFYIHHEWDFLSANAQKDFIKLVKKTEDEINSSGGIANKKIKIFYSGERQYLNAESNSLSLDALYELAHSKFEGDDFNKLTLEEQDKEIEILREDNIADSLEKKNINYANRIKNLDDIHFISYVPFGFNTKLLDIDKYIWFTDPYNAHFDSETKMPKYHTKGIWNYFDTSSQTNLGWRKELREYFYDKEVIVLVNNYPYHVSFAEHEDKSASQEILENIRNYSADAIEFFAEYDFDVKLFYEIDAKDGIPSKFDPKTEVGETNLKKWFAGLSNNTVVVLSQRIHPIDAMPGTDLLNGLDRNEVLGWYKNIYTCFLETPSSAELLSLDLSAEEANLLNAPTTIPRKKIFTKKKKNFQSYIRLQDIHNQLNPDMLQEESDELADIHIFLDEIKLIQYIFSKSNYHYNNKELFLKEAAKRLSMINGEDDIFIGDSVSLYFNEENKNANKGEILVELKKNSPDNKIIDSSLYKTQLIIDQVEQKVISRVATNFINIDIIRFSSISIEDGTFTAKFYFELTTIFDEGIDIISFKNSTLDSESSIVLIKKSRVDDKYIHFRYLIEDTFSFEAIPDNYPFDKQIIYIEYLILDEEKFGTLQPIQKGDVDISFQIDGWSLLQIRSGIYREKIKQRTIISNPLVKEGFSNQVGWMVKRSSSMTVLKIAIPLGFLWMLVLYGLFLPVENLDRAVGVITTSFLSGIALYFSTERPQPLRMTVIDLIFASFYITVGAASMSVFSLNFFPEVYEEYMAFIKYALPTSIFFIYWYLKKRINSSKYNPTMHKGNY
jgi:hypothetical protein